MKACLSVGVFDSGVGGLTVAKAIRKLAPQENVVYFGDSIHLPYGNKSEENVLRYSESSVQFLLRCKVKIIVVACNTAAAVALPALVKKHALPIIGVIEPGAREALKTSKSKKIGVIGTFRTIRSGAYRKALKEMNKEARVKQKATPLLVPLIEEGFRGREVIEGVIRGYLDPLAVEVDSVVLGCTHYPLIKSHIQRLYPRLRLIDSAQATARALVDTLASRSLCASREKGSMQIYTNDGNEVFFKIAKKLFPQEKALLIKETLDD